MRTVQERKSPVLDNGWCFCLPGGEGTPENGEKVLAIFPVHDSFTYTKGYSAIVDECIYNCPPGGVSCWWSPIYRINVHPICWQRMPDLPEFLKGFAYLDNVKDEDIEAQ